MILTICDCDHCLRSETSRMEPVELTSFTTDRSALPPEHNDGSNPCNKTFALNKKKGSESVINWPLESETVRSRICHKFNDLLQYSTVTVPVWYLFI
jgi:hypothetical protein